MNARKLTATRMKSAMKASLSVSHSCQQKSKGVEVDELILLVYRKLACLEIS